MRAQNLLKTTSAQGNFAVFCIFLMAIVLPALGPAAIVAGGAAIMTAYVLVLPDSFRSRRGSLTLAICLVTAMWLAALVVTALSWIRPIN
jgi:hypothetical protein